MKLKISTELPLNNTLQQTMPQSKAVLFSWNLGSDIPNQADVLVYRAADIFDDRFHLIEQGQSVENMLVLKLALAQQWMYCCKEEGSIESARCRAASMIKRCLLKQGTYIYMYRINGELKVNDNEKVTRLATKRVVNYIDVRQDVAEHSYQGNRTFNSSYLEGKRYYIIAFKIALTVVF